jgi:hypothetical protein
VRQKPDLNALRPKAERARRDLEYEFGKTFSDLDTALCAKADGSGWVILAYYTPLMQQVSFTVGDRELNSKIPILLPPTYQEHEIRDRPRKKR